MRAPLMARFEGGGSVPLVAAFLNQPIAASLNPLSVDSGNLRIANGVAAEARPVTAPEMIVVERYQGSGGNREGFVADRVEFDRSFGMVDIVDGAQMLLDPYGDIEAIPASSVK